MNSSKPASDPQQIAPQTQRNWLKTIPNPVGVFVTVPSGKRGKIVWFVELTPSLTVYHVRAGKYTDAFLWGELTR